MLYLKNFIVTSFIAISCLLSINYEIYLAVIIPVYVFLIFFDPLNAIYILISTLIYCLLFNINIYTELSFICIFTFFIRNLYIPKKILQFLYIILLSTISYIYFININNTYIIFSNYIIYTIIALLTYAIISYNTKNYFTTTYKLQFFNIYYYFTMIAIITIISTASLQTMYLSFTLAFLSISLLSIYKKVRLSIFLSIFTSYLFYFIYSFEIVLIFPIISLIYLYKQNSILSVSISILIFLYNKEYLMYSYLIFSSTIILEIYQHKLKNKPLSECNFKNTIYENILENFNDQVLKYATFLDNFAKNFTESKEYKIKMDNSIQYIIDKHCKHCKNYQKCFVENKLMLYRYLNLTIKHRDKIYYLNHSKDEKNFINSCKNSQNIIQTANYLNNKYNLDYELKKYDTSINNQLNGVSNILRQYTIDINSKTELEIDKYIKLKTLLKESGFNMFLFEIKKNNINDFHIDIGLDNVNKLTVTSLVKTLIEEILESKVLIEINSYRKNKSIYFSVFPEIKYNILYGQGSLAKEGLNISGDNYLIKNLNNSSFIAAISDGMGNGYMAFKESKSTLKMLDSITNFNLSANTSVNILNTFYALKDNLDNYATLDFVEINQINGLATIYKMGATETFILRGSNTLEVINNENLPFGIEDLILEKEIQLHNHDILILLSDGIIERLPSIKKFEEHLRLISHKPPQKIVYDILNYSVEENNSRVIDDMSVIVLKIEK